MSNLSTITLGELARGYRGVSYTPEQLLKHSTDTSFTLLRSNNIDGGFLNFTKIQIVPDNVVNEEQILKDGDITVCMSNGSKALVGKSAAYKNVMGRHTVGAFCSVFRPYNTSDSAFLSHVFQSNSFRKHIDFILAGSAINNLKNCDVEEFELINFAPNERLKIAEVLDVFNVQIRETEAIIAKLQQVKKGLLHDLLTRGVDENGELRPSYEDAPELYKPSELGWIPKDWDVKTIEELDGFVTSGSRDWAQYYSDYGDLFIRIGNLTREHINFRFDKIQCVTPPKYGDGQRTKLVSGDILISITADLGIIGVMSDDIGTAYINQHVAMVRFSNEEINPRFIGHFLGSEMFQALLSAKNDAGAKSGLNLPTVRSFSVLKVEKNEQDEITYRLDSMDKNVELERVNLNKLKLKKSGLMDDLLTGKVRINDLIKQQQTC